MLSKFIRGLCVRCLFSFDRSERVNTNPRFGNYVLVAFSSKRDVLAASRGHWTKPLRGRGYRVRDGRVVGLHVQDAAG